MCVLRDSRLSTEEKMLNSGLYRGCRTSVGVRAAAAAGGGGGAAAAKPRGAGGVAPETNVASRRSNASRQSDAQLA